METGERKKFALVVLSISVTIVIGLMIYYVANPPNDCQFSYQENKLPIESLFNYVQNNSFCNRIYETVPVIDQQGKTTYKKDGYYELTRREYEDMKRYGVLSLYLSAQQKRPAFHKIQ